MIESFTNSSLSTARACLRRFDLRYNLKLEVDEEDREVLAVGSAWHDGLDAFGSGKDPYEAIERSAPSPLWNEKLRRLFAAWVGYWENDPIKVLEAEQEFVVHPLGIKAALRGKIDGVVALPDGRAGIIEYKTTSDSLDAMSDYWDRLRLDTQTGIYAIAAKAIGIPLSFVIYDVVRKPTIRPKSPTKAEVNRMIRELDQGGFCSYYGETFGPEESGADYDLGDFLESGCETIEMYGARLTADIGDDPAKYFARREVSHSDRDFRLLEQDIAQQVEALRFADGVGAYYRNPDACSQFGRCDFFGLCSAGIEVKQGDPAPQGFRFREKLNPELA